MWETDRAILFFLVLTAPFVGSFLANFAVRWTEGESVAQGRSHCRSCGTTLGVADLVPILSWIALKGRCRHCGARVSALYPVTEVGALVLALWAAFAAPPELISLGLAPVSVVLGWVLLTLAVIDARSMVLPDMLTLPLIAAGLFTAWSLGGAPMLLTAFYGALLGGGLLALVAIVYLRLRKRAGLGWGDVKLLAAAGAWTGLQGVAGVLFLGAVLGLFYVACLRVSGSEVGRDTTLPFGPFLAGGFWLVWIYGPLF